MRGEAIDREGQKKKGVFLTAARVLVFIGYAGAIEVSVSHFTPPPTATTPAIERVYNETSHFKYWLVNCMDRSTQLSHLLTYLHM